MKRYHTALTGFFLLCTALFLLGGVSAHAESIKERMVERLPVINALKAKGIIGETSAGYLAYVGAQKEAEDVIAAENADRGQVYAAIARQQGTTVEVVGKRRALQITEKEKPGSWLQDANGKWHQKK